MWNIKQSERTFADWIEGRKTGKWPEQYRSSAIRLLLSLDVVYILQDLTVPFIFYGHSSALSSSGLQAALPFNNLTFQNSSILINLKP